MGLRITIRPLVDLHHLRMPEGKTHRHRRRHRIFRILRPCMRGPLVKSHVLHQIPARVHAKQTLRQTEINHLKSPRIFASPFHRVETSRKMSANPAILHKRPQRIRITRPILQLQIKTLPSPPPARPSPDLRITGKIIRIPGRSFLEIITTDQRDPRFRSIALQKLPAKPEKRRVRQTIVFQDDPFFHLLEEPRNRPPQTDLASLIAIALQTPHLAWPVDLIRRLPGQSTKLFLPLFPLTRTVRRDEKPLRPHFPEPVKHPCRQIRTVENHKKDWRHGRIRHEKTHLQYPWRRKVLQFIPPGK